MMDDLASRDALKALIAELKQVSSDSVPSILEKYRATGVLRAINNSIVGTSKLLHFFLPENIPIWDSVLGRSFGMIHRHQFHREDRFLIYVQAVHSAVRSAAISWKELDIVASQSSGPVSKVRKVEFALYAFARRRMALEGVPS
ncbi:hypothetical protein ACQR0V_12175 [Bradyrhizobium sp. HKCCYLS2058]|uniref:hypothetical protein n=1 Tax=unclassified Bradyrhizobium TaxID=2631580 RepID=UPI003EB9E6FB